MLKIKQYCVKNYPARLSAVVLLMVVISFEAFPAGTPAGTVIQSRSRVTYTTLSGAVADTVYSNTVSFTVSHRAAFNISPASGQSQSASDSSWVAYPVVIRNSGNGTDKASITVQSSKGWLTQLYFDANGDGIVQPGELSAGIITETSSLPADNEYKLILRIFVPRGDELNGQKDTTAVIVSSAFDNTKTAVGTYTTSVRTANLGIPSSLSVSNPVANAGAEAVFTVTLHNNGSVDANSVIISNNIPSPLTFVSATTTQGTLTNSSNTVVWSIGSIPAGSTVTSAVTMLVNSSTIAGTVLNNQMTVQYTVAENSYSSSTNISQITVGGVSARNVDIISAWTSLTKEALDTAVYRFTVRNTGSAGDIIKLTTASSLGFPWVLFGDANGNFVYDGADVPAIATDSLNPGDSVSVFAVVIIPRLSSNGLKDTLTVSASSLGDNSKNDAEKTVTTINTPQVSISKSVLPVGSQPPGTEMTYTISYRNSGNASVSNFSIVDKSPSPTSYIANSIKVNGASVLDNNPSVSVTDDGSGNKIIAVSLGILSAQSSGSIEFKVKIK